MTISPVSPACSKRSVRRHDRDLRPGRDADAAGLAQAGRQRVRGHLVRGLGHAVGFDHRAAEGRFELGHHLRRQRGGRRADEAQLRRRERFRHCAPRAARIAWCMVGTAVYQLGLASSSHWKKRSALKPGRAEDAAARGERRQHRRDQPVDVEQRHDVEAAVVRPSAAASRRYARPRPPGWRG